MLNVMEKTKVCDFCEKKNERLELMLKGILGEIGCSTLFVTWNKFLGDFTVFTGDSNMSDELECSCPDE